MATKITFRVDDIPPKKDGANSMWGKPAEIPRLIALRRAAHQAMAGRHPLNYDVSLTLQFHCPSSMLSQIGDLDNFITGICDGLQAADPRAGGQSQWSSVQPHEIHPQNPIAILDDAHVTKISASKIGDAKRTPWYEVTIEGNDRGV